MEHNVTSNSPVTGGRSLTSGWLVSHTSAGLVTEPDELREHGLSWIAGRVPGTVAQIFTDFSEHNNLDDFDWWYQCSFDGVELLANQLLFLRLEGLATLADVWINGRLILQSNNMFVANKVDITSELKDVNTVTICFRSLTEFLSARRARPRWKTNLVNHQQLRWVRTTLLGRIPGWTPSVPPVGPWKGIRLEQVAFFELLSSRLTTQLIGLNGKVEACFTIEPLSKEMVIASAFLNVGETKIPLDVSSCDQQTGYFSVTGDQEIEAVKQWWPYTHGEPELYECSLVLTTSEGVFDFPLGNRGFKAIELENNELTTGFKINGIDVFCRGACWTVNDFITLIGDKSKLEESLILARAAGINMLRIGGTMVYECDEFYDICDQLGIMVWQDFMFAGSLYSDDEHFLQNINQNTCVLSIISEVNCFIRV